MMKRLFDSLQTYANQLLGLMLAKCIHIRRVYPYPSVFIRIGKAIQRHVDSHLNETKPVASQIWSCPVLNEQDQIEKSRVSIQQADREKIVSLLMVFVLIATLCLKPCAAFITFSLSRGSTVSH